MAALPRHAAFAAAIILTATFFCNVRNAALADASAINAADSAWMISATALVLMMTIRVWAVLFRHGAQEERAGDDGAKASPRWR